MISNSATKGLAVEIAEASQRALTGLGGADKQPRIMGDISLELELHLDWLTVNRCRLEILTLLESEHASENVGRERLHGGV
jgi:hypothetical protein